MLMIANVNDNDNINVNDNINKSFMGIYVHLII